MPLNVQSDLNFHRAFFERGYCRLKIDKIKGVEDLNRSLTLAVNQFDVFLARAAHYSSKGRYSKVGGGRLSKFIANNTKSGNLLLVNL